MEQIEQVGAFGKFQFNDDEQQAFTAMHEVFGKYRGDVDHIWPMNVHNHRDKQRIADAVQALLPPKVKVEDHSDSYGQNLRIRSSSRNLMDYQRIPSNTTEIIFYVTLGNDLKTRSGRIELLSSSNQKEHYLSVITEKIEGSLVDDLVNILGKGITPTLYGLQTSHYKNFPGTIRGIPQVHRLEEISALYARVESLVNNREFMGDYQKDFNELEQGRDSKNPAIREISEQMYSRKLTELLLSGPQIG